jgi:hypothetical protein
VVIIFVATNCDLVFQLFFRENIQNLNAKQK